MKIRLNFTLTDEEQSLVAEELHQQGITDPTMKDVRRILLQCLLDGVNELHWTHAEHKRLDAWKPEEE